MEGHQPPGDARAPASRRRFIGLLAGAAAAALARPRGGEAVLHALVRQSVHPEPRPGIDASKVLTAPQLQHAPDAVKFFDWVREIPQIADGIGCYCGCATLPGYRSLLSCYESPGMAQHCLICQGQARLAYHRWKEGQTLEQIRRAIDARYGHGDAEKLTADHCHDR